MLFHINDKDGRGSKKSLSYTHLFKKRQNSTIQAAGVRRNSVKAGVRGVGGGRISHCANDKRQE